ncbi:MAG: transcriptional regulator GcvA [Nevskia sp.]|nr:transcriptional regulator GcvA [Nevskia sp.]
MRLPPLNALRAFEAAARHRSVNKAARELHVTPAAISHQIKALEEQLGVQLFKRMPRRIELTVAGETCLPKLSAAFLQMEEAIASLRLMSQAGRILVNIPPALGARWLMPKLQRFSEVHPEIDLRIAVRPTMVDKARRERGETSYLEGADIAIRFGGGEYPDHVAHKLFTSYSTPMCSPRLLEGEHPLRTPDDLRHHTLLHFEDDWHTDAERPTWDTWLKAAGVKDVNTRRGPTFNHITLAMDAAADGMGVVLGVLIAASADIAAGRLVVPFPLCLPVGASYYLVYPAEREPDAAVRAFRDWVLSEARAERWAEPAEMQVWAAEDGVVRST